MREAFGLDREAKIESSRWPRFHGGGQVLVSSRLLASYLSSACCFSTSMNLGTFS